MDVTEAYAECERITRNEAKNFAYGIRLLPAPKRRAMSALYALARRIDDVGDGDLPVDSKLAALDGIEADLGEPGAHPDDPVMTAVADAAGTYPIPLTAFGEIIEGCRRDSTGTRYTTFEELVVYCRLVAGSVGRLSLGVFGCTRPEEGNRLADSLGVALQLTNILRDIVEDRTVMGRIYLPTEDIERFGCSPDLTGPEDAVAALVSFEAARADGWYDEGLAL
ncbi:MAG TPA: squalene/phytoene synthase family protein, partial [Acidimicrobiales bacterium]|nr:squalene/phytoene synthase family protein [Acidimicrobiales bacterium]